MEYKLPDNFFKYKFTCKIKGQKVNRDYCLYQCPNSNRDKCYKEFTQKQIEKDCLEKNYEKLRKEFEEGSGKTTIKYVGASIVCENEPIQIYPEDLESYLDNELEVINKEDLERKLNNLAKQLK